MPLGGEGEASALRGEEGQQQQFLVRATVHFLVPETSKSSSFQNIFLSVQSLKIRIFFENPSSIPFLRRMLQIIMKFNKNSMWEYYTFSSATFPYSYLQNVKN